jgi:hypothetical protein
MSRFRNLVVRAGCVLALVLLLSPLGVGQQRAKNAPDKAAIDGTVTDSMQAIVSGAIVVLSNGSGWKQETKTGSKGEYAFTGLEGGTYKLTITAPRFAVKTLDDLSLTPGSEVTLDLSLELAAAKSEVNVVAQNTGQVEVEKSELSGTITQTQLTKIGLNGRNFTQLIALVPGVTNQTGQDEAKVGVQGSVKYSVNGGRVEYNIFEVDGSDVLNTGLNGASSTLMVYPSLDAIQETKVLTSNYGAQYGRTASGIVQVTTKSGGAQFHGNLYEFLRNEDFNAKGYFDPGGRAPLYRRNDFGGTIGGPLTIPGVYNKGRNKTFFFFSEEARLEKTPTDYDQAVPSLKERGLIMTPNGIRQNSMNVNGRVVQVFDFSDVCPPGGTAYSPQQYPDCPVIGRGTATAGPVSFLVQNTTLAPGLIPATAVDKNVLAILNSNLIPLPNSPTGCNYSVANFDVTDPNHCYDTVISPSTYWREELFRIDHNITDNTKLSFRYIHDAWNTTVLAPQWSYEHQNFPSTGTFPTVQNRFVGPGVSLVGTLTNILSTTLVNNLLLSYVDSHITLSDQNGPGGAQYQLNPSLYQPLVADPANPGVCNPTLNVEPGSTNVSTTNAASSGGTVPQCGMGYIFNNGFGGKMPGVAILGTNAAYGGSGFSVDPSYMPWSHTNPTYSVRDDISKSIGKHMFVLGTQYVYSQRNQTNNVIGAASGEQQGLLTFNNLANSTGNAFADFLLGDEGYIQSYVQDSGQQRYYQRYQLAEPYLQDDWKVTPRLTLNLGVRMSLFGTYSEKNHNVWNWEASRFNSSEFAVDPLYGTLLYEATGKPVQFNSSTLQLDPGVASALGLVQCGVNGTPASCMKGHLFNPAPRIGFAWDPAGDGKTSIRGGYGIFYEHGTGNEANTGSLEASSPVVLSMTQPNPLNYMCIGNVGYGNGNNSVCGFAGSPAPPSASSAYPLDVTAIPTQAVWPYVQQWSFGAQRQLATGLMLDMAYVGSKGTHLTVERQLNQAQPLPASENPFGPNEPLTVADCKSWTTSNGQYFLLENGTAVTQQNPAYVYLETACAGLPGLPNVNSLPNRPYPGLGEIYSLENVANSNYNSLQMKLQRTAGALTAGVVYVYSHSIDDSSDRSDPVLVNSYDLQENRASSDFDQRHSLIFNYLYRIPGARLRNFLSSWRQPWCVADDQHPCSAPPRAGEPDQTSPLSRWGRLLFDGWELSGLTVFQSGTPFSVINSAGNDGISMTDNAGVAEGLGMAASYPDVVPAGRYYAPVTNAQSSGTVVTAQNEGPLLGNPLEFVAPRGLTFGDAGRNFLNNPHRFNSDIALLKHFRLSESAALEFRAEVFNVFNNTQFQIYDPNNPGSSGNNVISCYAGPNYSAGYWAQGGPNCTSGASFLHPVDAHRPRTMQFGLKLSF